jgi:hypothetical protein
MSRSGGVGYDEPLGYLAAHGVASFHKKARVQSGRVGVRIGALGPLFLLAGPKGSSGAEGPAPLARRGLD